MTDKYLVFGNPIAHSMSPSLHAYFAKITQQDLVYDRSLVEEGRFKECADEFFSHGGLGCNITVPCKLDAYSYANTLTDYAKAAGAVNTLKKLDDGTILGDNTDGRGLVRDLLRLKCPLQDSKVLIIGAGGACQGILKPILETNPKSIAIVNRTLSKAEHLASLYQDKVTAASFENLEGSFDVIINATSLSLKNELPNLSDELLGSAKFVYDLMYRKDGDTVFTKKAKALGVTQSFDGFGMLIGQAILSFELWRGVEVDFDKAIEHFMHA